MGVLDKVMFWKKKEEDMGDLGLGGDFENFGKDLTGLEGAGTNKTLPGFGEREHIEGMEKPLGTVPGAPKTEETTPSYETHAGYQYSAPSPQPAQMQSRDQIMMGKELELISTKLDSIKVSLDSLNMRLASLERIARGEYEKSW